MQHLELVWLTWCRFPFWALNTKLRSQAQAQAKVYIRKYPGAADLTVADIQAKMQGPGKATFLKSIQRFINMIPGLSPYWHAHRNKLTAMVQQIGCPHIFFTLSAADLHWPELHRLIEEQRVIRYGGELLDLSTLGEQAAYNRRINNLTNYPHIVALFIQNRVKMFLETIQNCPTLAFDDFWYRFEWQDRGSGHVHGFLWLTGGPEITDARMEDPAFRQTLVDFFKTRVFGQSPLPDLPRPDVHPCQVPGPVNKDNRTDVTELLNRCQRHVKCLASYCLKFNRRINRIACRFGFPQPVKVEATIEKNDKGQWTYYPARSLTDINLNRFSPICTSMWRGNTDISPCLGPHAVTNYIGKYATKAEKMSKHFEEVVLQLASAHGPTDGISTLLAQTLNKFCIERDFSAQEACHQLMSLPMVDCSRVFESITLNADLTVTQVLRARENAVNEEQGRNVPATKTLLERYMIRPQELEDICYLDMIKGYIWNKNKRQWTRRGTASRAGKQAVVQINPWNWSKGLEWDASKLNFGRNDPAFGIAARRACMLYVPFRNVSRLADLECHLNPAAPTRQYDVDRSDVEIWQEVLLHLIQEKRNLFPEHIINLIEGVTEDDFNVQVDLDDDSDDDDLVDRGERRQEEEWQRMARIRANVTMGQPREFFGLRAIDLNCDWNMAPQQFDLGETPDTYIAQQKLLDPTTTDEHIRVLPDQLNTGQRRVYDYSLDALSRMINHPDGLEAGSSLNSIIMGTAGVGKSFLIRAVEWGVWELFKDKFGDEEYPTIRTAVKLAAFTGKAAFQVGGVTIHSLLSVGGLYPHKALQPRVKRKLQQELRNTKLLIIDEKSMVGLRLLRAIDVRLREAFPERSGRPFGGISVMLFGDFGQLPPVLDAALYARLTEKSPASIHAASRLYKDNFRTAFQLTEQMRQQGLSEEDLKFGTALLNMRVGAVTPEDWQFFQHRVLSEFPVAERLGFANAISLFMTNNEVRERNTVKLEELHSPVAQVISRYRGATEMEGRTVDSDLCGGLQHSLYLAIGARVFFYLEVLTHIVGHVNQEYLAD